MDKDDKRDLMESRVSDTIQVQNVAKEAFGWEVPVEAIPVPSEGKVYPPDSPIFNKKILEIKAMTAQEEDILSSRALIQQGTVITHLIQSCLVDKSIDVRNMLLGDRNALMVSVRITGYGSEYAAESRCPSCSVTSRQEYNLSNLEIKRLEINPVSEGENIFEFVLPVTGKSIHFKFLTGADEEERSLVSERKKKMLPDMKIDSLVTSKLEQLIVAINGVTDKNKINHFVKSMPALDSRKLRSYIEKNEPGIDMSVWMNCPSCSETSRVSLPIGSNFFWPDD